MIDTIFFTKFYKEFILFPFCFRCHTFRIDGNPCDPDQFSTWDATPQMSNTVVYSEKMWKN